MPESVIISTLVGSVVCIALLLFKHKILSLLGGRALYYISLSAMLLFLLPLNVPEMPAFRAVSDRPPSPAVHYTEPEEAPSPSPQPAAVQPQVTPQLPPDALSKASPMVRRENPITMREIITIVWFLGFLFSISRYLLSYFRFKRRICGFTESEVLNGVTVIKSPLISSPMIFGFFKPTLAIPETEMQASDYALAIKHEMVHFKHHDAWFKLYAVLVNALCWFNPITYFMVTLIGEACEYACDAQVVKEMNTDEKKQYSTMILSLLAQSSPALSSNMAKNKKQLKRRFEMILNQKKRNRFQAVVCILLILTLTCGSVVFANDAAPFISAHLQDNYVYVSNYGNHEYNEFVPVEKDGTYYLPLREFLNKSDIDNDKIKYENGKITIDFWTNELVVYNASVFEVGKQSAIRNASEREIAEVHPAQYAWSAVCTVGSPKVTVGDETHTLSKAPYMENGITYAPYEFFRLMRLYEHKCMSVGERIRQKTAKLHSLMLFGFNSADAEYYSDYIQIGQLVSTDSYAHVTYNANAKIARTGYRTAFEAAFDYFDLNDTSKQGNVKISLNKVTRIYSRGSDIEGLFTVVVDGKTVYDNEPGNITSLPLPAGEGILNEGRTSVQINDLIIDVFFSGFNIPFAYNERAREVGKITEMPETVKLTVIPEKVKLNGYSAVRGSSMYSHLFFNKAEKLVDMNIMFDSYNGENNVPFETYRIYTGIDSEMTVIDENTFSAELYFTKGYNMRADSFDAVITLLPENGFELRSHDGNYIIIGKTEPFVPQWQWTEEQKNAPIPQVTMISA